MDELVGLELSKAFMDGVGKASVEKLTNAIGGMFPFVGTSKKAVDIYIAEIEKEDIPPIEKAFKVKNTKKAFKDYGNQMKIGAIALEQAKEGTDFSDDSKVDEEWLSRFMDAARHVSDEKAQYIWGRVLAGEFESPGNTPLQTTRILSELTEKYAKLFSIICSTRVTFFTADEAGNLLLPYERIVIPGDYHCLWSYGIDFETIGELAQLGLIELEYFRGFTLVFDHKAPMVYLEYGGIVSTIHELNADELYVGFLRLTEAGRHIAKFITLQILPEHFKNVIDFYKKRGVHIGDAGGMTMHRDDKGLLHCYLHRE